MRMKQKLFSILALLLMAVTGAWAKEFTSLKVGDVLHVGDVINTGTNYRVGITDLDANFQPATLVRGNIGTMDITESETGAYYLIKDQYGVYFGVIEGEGYEGGYWPVTDTSDGISVTAITPGDYGYTELTFAVHEGPATYKITVAEGTEDAENWIVPEEAEEGSSVTATYKGEKKVKSVKAVKVAPAATDLATITADYEVKDGETLTGTLASNVKISIADGATVTLDNVTISGVDDGNYMWAGLNCLGDATIILKDGTKNKITGFHNHFPAIYIPGDRHNPENNKTLIIKGGDQGTGKLIARNNGEAAGIGGVKSDAWLNQLALSAGNIEIQGGVIEAYAGRFSAAIGAAASDTCGYIRISGGDIIADGGERGVGIGCGTGMNEASCEAHCGDITITGGKIEAYGTGGAAIGCGTDGVCGNITISGGIVQAIGSGFGCPGIGSGYKDMFDTGCGDILIDGGAVQAYGGSSAPGIGCSGSGDQGGTCRNITITSKVTKLYAEMGTGATNSIGPADSEGKCGTVTIGGEVYWQNGSYVGEGSDYLQQNPIRYEPTN